MVGWELAHSIAHSEVPINSSILIDTYDLSLTVFELFNWVKKRFAHLPDADMMTIIALEAMTIFSSNSIFSMLSIFNRGVENAKFSTHMQRTVDRGNSCVTIKKRYQVWGITSFNC